MRLTPAGIGVSVFTVVMTLIFGLPAGSAVVWSGVLAVFAISAIQGRIDRSQGRQPDHGW